MPLLLEFNKLSIELIMKPYVIFAQAELQKPGMNIKMQCTLGYADNLNSAIELRLDIYDPVNQVIDICSINVDHSRL